MTIKHELRSCPHCGTLTTVKVRRPNHVLHALFSVLTLGLWIPIWLLAMVEASFSRGKVRCPNCEPRHRRWG